MTTSKITDGPENYRVEMALDRSGGMQAGSPPSWIRVTHLPTMISATAYECESQHRAREAAFTAVELLVDISRREFCVNPENCKFK